MSSPAPATALQNVLYEKKGAIAYVTLNRPKVLNALNRRTWEDLRTAFEDAREDAAVRGVILTGAGEKAFIAGADIGELARVTAVEAERSSTFGQDVLDLVENLGKPVIAAVNGFALGGGCELAMACDFVYASDRAKFGQPEVNLGLMPGFGGTQRLLRRVGAARAAELVFSTDMISAEEALRIGLVNAVVPGGELLARARAQAQKIAGKAPLAIAASKRALRRAEELSLQAGNELERELFSVLFSTADQKEGTAAFLEKRPPKFTAR